MGAMYSYGAQ